MRIALIISGYLRSFKENIENLKKNIIDNNEVDIYIHITKHKEKKYNNKDINLDEVYDLLHPKFLMVTDNILFNDNENINNLLNQNYKFYLLNEERKKIEKAENINYSFVIKIRPDINLQERINLNDIDLNKIYIPLDSKIDTSKLLNKYDNCICDVFAYGKPELMNKYFNFYKELMDLIIKYGYNSNEVLLYHYLNNNNIEYNLIDINYIIILSLCNVIAISGDSGSGKTLLSSIIKQIYNNSFIIECDRYHKWERNDENWNTYTHLNPKANYITKMCNDIFNLKIGNNIYSLDYDHKTGKFMDNAIIESSENLIVCGLHSLYISKSIINIKIYMDTDENLKFFWKMKRDIQKRGYSIEKIKNQIEKRKEDYNNYIYSQKNKSDIIINLYTNKQFNCDFFNKNENYPVFLKIGIKNIYNITNIIIKIDSIVKIEENNDYIFLYFNENYNYKDIINVIISNI